MRLERTVDMAAISRVIGHEAIKGEVWDANGNPEILLHDSIYYLLPTGERHADGAVEDVVLGVVAFMPVNTITWNPHVAILPEHRGCGTQALELGVRWMFENTPCRKIVAHPPTFNVRMIRVFEKCGFKPEGYSPKSFGWRGEVHDRVLMGLEAT